MTALSQARVLCVGAAVLDTIYRVRTLPIGEGKVLPYEMIQIAEGMASSAAYAVVRLGGEASLWAAVGDDHTGDRIVSDLKRAGIDTTGMLRVEGARSAVSTILVDDSGERLVIPYYEPRLHGVAKSVAANDVASFDAVLVDVRWPQLALTVLEAAKAAGKPAILDGDVAPTETLEILAPAASHIIFSRPAAERLSGNADVTHATAILKERYPAAFVATTAGAEGCFFFDDDRGKVHQILSPRVDVIDTLAAGDIFHGAFAIAIAERMPAKDAVRFSCVAAALKCLVFGGRTGAPSRAEVMERLSQI